MGQAALLAGRYVFLMAGPPGAGTTLLARTIADLAGEKRIGTAHIAVANHFDSA
jgi:predicted ATPase with chaperone activity